MIRRNASVVTQKPRGYPDAIDSRQLPEARALAADERDLRLVDLLEIQDVGFESLRYVQGGRAPLHCGSRLSLRHDGLHRTPRLARPHLVLSLSC